MEKPHKHLIGGLFLLWQQSTKIIPAQRGEPGWRRLLHVVPVERVQLFKVEDRRAWCYTLQGKISYELIGSKGLGFSISSAPSQQSKEIHERLWEVAHFAKARHRRCAVSF